MGDCRLFDNLPSPKQHDSSATRTLMEPSPLPQKEGERYSEHPRELLQCYKKTKRKREILPLELPPNQPRLDINSLQASPNQPSSKQHYSISSIGSIIQLTKMILDDKRILSVCIERSKTQKWLDDDIVCTRRKVNSSAIGVPPPPTRIIQFY